MSKTFLPLPLSVTTRSARRPRMRGLAALLALGLVACGGGGESGSSGGDTVAPPVSCSSSDLKTWLSDYFDHSYFWYAIGPRPSPGASASVGAHFDALLYAGGTPPFPADRWSNYESTESFNRFYGDGQTLGYGVSVAGLEVSGQPAQPLYVRGVDPGSPAALAGVVRGDRVLAINGRATPEILAPAEPDFSALSPTAAGQSLTLSLRSASGADRTVTLTAAVYALTPVPRVQTLSTVAGRKVGYIDVRNMVSQVQVPLEAAFAGFRTQAVQDVVLDLRYNGGGLVSMGRTVASYVAGTRAAGQVYAKLLYSDKRAALNESFSFTSPASAASLPRVYVLTGRRTCSASEQVINGLRGAGVQVFAVGETTCGKPVGFLPESDSCGTTYSVVNFESVNRNNEGRYFDGFMPTCSVAEDWTQPVGGAADPLVRTALLLADGGACASGASAGALKSAARGRWGAEPGERQQMLGR